MVHTKTHNAKSWPTDPASLPFMMTEKHTAHLLNCTPRTMQRDRMAGTGCTFVKLGKRIFYTRDAVLAYIAKRGFASTAAAKKEAAAG